MLKRSIETLGLLLVFGLALRMLFVDSSVRGSYGTRLHLAGIALHLLALAWACRYVWVRTFHRSRSPGEAPLGLPRPPGDGKEVSEASGEEGEDHLGLLVLCAFCALAALYPEAGVHFWANERIRITGSAAYYITTEGRAHDFWFYSVGVSLMAY